MTNIYDLHEAAFRDVSAYVVANGATGERVATIAFKYARSGLRTTCYLHVLGTPMVKAFASGGGYDKASAALHYATKKLREGDTCSPLAKAHMDVFKRIIKDEGQSWEREVRDAGYNLLRAV